MRRLVTISFTGLDAGGGVPKFNRDLHAAFPDRECIHLCWDDFPKGGDPGPEWEKARLLNQYLLSTRKLLRDDVVVADGFWASGLEHLPFAISHSHGIWGHITQDDVIAGRPPENPFHHAAQVNFRRRWTKLRKPFTAVSDFIAEQMRLQWGFVVDRVIDNGIDLEVYRPSAREMILDDLLIVHGINDRGNVNKGWDHIEEIKRGIPSAHVLSLDEAHVLLNERSRVPLTKPESLALADLFVHPSGYEGNSMMVAEALACGLPFVGYNVGFAWRLWRDAGGPCTSVGEILDRRDRSPQSTLGACRRVLERFAGESSYDHSGNHHMGDVSRMIAERHLSIGRFRDSWREYVAEVEARGA